MKIVSSKIPDIKIIEPTVHGDDRGYFFESYKEERFIEKNLPVGYIQENQAKSQKGVLRGLHYQLEHPQGKLVTVPYGRVWDVAVDLRQSSETFGQWIGIEISQDNHRSVYIPQGFAHGYCVLSEEAIFQYKCTDTYHPEDEYGLLWNDADLGITWPIKTPLISEKDLKHPILNIIQKEKLFA
ncbi:MAG: dTDP-4-dehydrorhamnose 3,5-epimerase [Candidatus Marinimicrobia bacterium]|nr:dTDP-4-dehydrorhamnose 3,5-epimerase [Candidatus Neomarinimicrobiota bacterium]